MGAQNSHLDDDLNSPASAVDGNGGRDAHMSPAFAKAGPNSFEIFEIGKLGC